MGLEYATTVVCAMTARSAVVHQSAITVVGAITARSAVGLESASTVVAATNARSAMGQQSASTVVGALHARSAAGHNMRARSSPLRMQGLQKRTNVIIHTSYSVKTIATLL